MRNYRKRKRVFAIIVAVVIILAMVGSSIFVVIGTVFPREPAPQTTAGALY